jgi:hypothetical protein
MSYGYYGKGWFVYLAELNRKDETPAQVYKIGITNARDPMLRLTYQGADELYPILKYFPETHLLKHIWFPTQDKAERAERFIMWKVKQMTNSDRFHNWREKDPISGITEMRVWNDREVELCIGLLEECTKRYNY